MTFVRQITAFAARAVALLGVSFACLAQTMTTTTVTASSSAVGTGEGVNFTATITGPVSYDVRFTAGTVIAQGNSIFIRYDLIDGAFASNVVTGGFQNITSAGATSAPFVIQGGGAGDRYVVMQITGASARGTLADDVLSLLLPGVTATGAASPQVRYSAHQFNSSAVGTTPPNTSLLASPAPAALSTFLTANNITGNVTFRADGTIITGCAAVTVASASATCATSFATFGTRAITATYNGDVNFLASTGTLASGVTVGLSVTPTALASAQVGVAVSAGLSAAGGTAPYSFTLATGTLPPGISLTINGGFVGTPTAAGTYTFTVRAQDSAGFGGTRNYTWVVAKGTQTISFVPPVSGFVGVPLVLTGSATSGLPLSYRTVMNPVCSVSGSTVTFSLVGSCTVTASQAGDANWLAATDVDRVFSVFASGGARAIRIRSANGVSMKGELAGNQMVFSVDSDPGTGFRVVASALDIDRNGAPDLVYQNTTQGEFGDVRVWKDYQSSLDRLLRQVKLTWRVDATGDLDGDGFGDLVWRFTGQSPNIDDTGVSYIWFTNGTDVTQVRKRGGAPLNWTLLGAADINRDRAADMLYISPEGSLRVLMATTSRTCANFSAGNLPAGYTAMHFADFTGNRFGEVFLRDLTTGQNRILVLDGTSLSLPAPTANPDDPNASCTATTQPVNATLRTFFAADASFQLFSAIDLNGDGITDLVWLKPNGQLQVWVMAANAGIPTIFDNAGTVPAGFSVLPK